MHPHTCPPSLHPWPRGVGCGHRGAGGAHLHILIPPSALILSAPHLGSVSVFGGTERTPGWDRMGMLGVPLSPPPHNSHTSASGGSHNCPPSTVPGGFKEGLGKSEPQAPTPSLHQAQLEKADKQ